MRLNYLVGALLAWTLAIGAEPPVNDADIHVTARLMSIQQAPGCGVFMWFSLAKYHVISGPTELVGKDIDVQVPCAEMPRAFAAGEGNLESFVPGEAHDLTLSRKNFLEPGVSIGNADPNWWYLRAASVHVNL